MDNQVSVDIEAVHAVAEARIPAMIVGAPGTGKTAYIRQMAEDMGYGLITLVGSQMAPEDISGLPAPSSYIVDGKEWIDQSTGKPLFVTTFYQQWWQAEILTKKNILVFFDEFSNTPPSVRASLLTFFQDRQFPNGAKLPEATIVLGAMNPISQAADGSELDLPTKNRMFFIPWNPPVELWYQGMMKAWGREGVSDQEMYYRKMIVDFNKKNAGYLHVEPDDELAEQGGDSYGANLRDDSEHEVFYSAWPSRRSWDNLAFALGKANRSKSAVQDIIAQGLVGYRAAAAFREFLAQQATYDPREVLEDPDVFDWTDTDPSPLSIVIRGIMDIMKPEDYEKVTDFFIRVAKEKRQSEGGPYIRSLIEYITEATSKNGGGTATQNEMARKIFHAYQGVGTASMKKD